MAFYLVGEKQTLPVWQARRFGRVEFIPAEEGVVVKNHGSSKELRVGGRLIAPSEDVLAPENTRVEMAGVAFTVRNSKSQAQARKKLAYVDFTVAAVLVLLSLNAPDMAWGMSSGLANVAIIVGCVLASVFYIAVMARVLTGWVWWTPKTYAAYGVISAVLASGVYYGVMEIHDRDGEFTRAMITARVEYFCLTRPNPAECVRQTNVCPACALKIEKWKRDLMVQNLKKFQSELRSPASPPAPAN